MLLLLRTEPRSFCIVKFVSWRYSGDYYPAPGSPLLRAAQGGAFIHPQSQDTLDAPGPMPCGLVGRLVACEGGELPAPERVRGTGAGGAFIYARYPLADQSSIRLILSHS